MKRIEEAKLRRALLADENIEKIGTYFFFFSLPYMYALARTQTLSSLACAG